MPALQDFDLARASTARLIQELAHPNLTRRMHAMNELVDRVGTPAVRPLERMLSDKKSSAEQKAHGLWVLHRLGGLNARTLATATRDSDRLVRVHAMRVLSETSDWTSSHRKQVLAGLNDADPYVQRAAADALSTHPHPEHVRPLLEARPRVPTDDVQLLHVVRMALRNQLKAPGSFEQMNIAALNEADSRALTDVALGIQSPGAGSLVLNHARKFSRSSDGLINYLRHAARFAPDAELDGIAELTRAKFPDDLDLQFALFKSVQDGLAQRGAKLTPRLRHWAAELAAKLLAPADDSQNTWTSIPLVDATESPWFLQKRKSADGDEESVFLCSLPPNGETLTGILRTRIFTVPPKLTFFIAGHDGFPDQPPGQKNLIRLRAADSPEILMSAPPPRNDLAQRVTWDLSAHAGKQGVLEIVDGDTGTAYAWLAAGRFDPVVVPLPQTNPSERNQRPLNAAELARTVPLPELAGRFAALFNDTTSPNEFRAAAAQTLMALDAPAYTPLTAGTLADTNQPAALRERLALILSEQNAPVARSAVLDALRAAPQRLQIRLALLLAGGATGADALLALVEQKKLSPQVIADRAVKERLAVAGVPQFNERYETLTRGVAPVSAELQKLIDGRRTGFAAAATSVDRGRAVFEKACAACHQRDGKGAVVGPQLDGVGTRGLERIIEDVLDPNRNLDPAFTPSLITLKDDTSITGLQHREAGEVLVFVDTLGKEITVPKREIAERRESQISLMPANFGETLTAAEFYDLMAYLLK
jgi:putative heme-binding domain-containing protein